MALLRFRVVLLMLVMAGRLAMAQTGSAATGPAPTPPPRMVEKGGGIGRLFAWTSLITGIAGGLASAGLYAAASADLQQCEDESLVPALQCADKQQQLDDATSVATLGAIGAGALLGTSIVLFVVTEGSHMELEVGPPPPPKLPIAGYVATGVALTGAITAHVIMSNARSDLADASTHPSQAETETLVGRYHKARYASGGLYGLSAAFGVMATLGTLTYLRGRDGAGEAQQSQLSFAPTTRGGALTLTGTF